MSPVLSSRVFNQGDTMMLTRLAHKAFSSEVGTGSRKENASKQESGAALRRHTARASTLGLFLALFATGSAFAQQGTPEQRRACTPDVYRLCAGEIPNARAITACLRRQKASLSQACAAVFEQ
jgi:hypothetical protein